MLFHTDFLKNLDTLAKASNHRFAVVLEGDSCWKSEVVRRYLGERKTDLVSKLGGTAIGNEQLLSYKKGQQLLGSEREVIIYDDSDGFDANSFTASTGSLVGGGVLFILHSGTGTLQHAWFGEAFSKLIRLSADQVSPELPVYQLQSKNLERFYDQEQAIAAIRKVRTGHRKRPLVITADRGRGKSAALGIAAARMMVEKNTEILITAPGRKSVDPVFSHALQGLTDVVVNEKNSLQTNGSSIQFISPDELLRTKPECDILFVDEASAIPIPMLISMVESYHRVVFSTTVHGYEGCGRGFTIKFSAWLDKNRPGWKLSLLKQPIRWNVNDPLEEWLFSTFLLDADLDDLPQSSQLESRDSQEVTLNSVCSEQLSHNRALLRQCFALLVNAHYQTSPNDLLHLLEDKNTYLVTIELNSEIVGCLLLLSEGGMDQQLIEGVVSGKRRPKGHLVATTIATQLCTPEAAKQKCLRVMRIAVHPGMQGRGIGSQALSKLSSLREIGFDYIATSFGVTSELLKFWTDNEFVPLRLGAKRDQASGTNSILMVQKNDSISWMTALHRRFALNLLSLLPETFSQTEAELVLDLMVQSSYDGKLNFEYTDEAVRGYCLNALSYESAFYDIYQFICQRVFNEAHRVHPLVVAKIFQRISWPDLAVRFGFSGRKQAEARLKEELGNYLNLQCKL